MIRNILIGVLALGIAGTAYWGYREHQEKNAVLIHAENNYQRAFHDLTYQIDLLHDKIGTTLAMNSRASLSPALAEVWRIASEAHADVGQLPLSLLPFNKTQEFLAKIGEFSYRTAVRDLEKEPLTKDEYRALQTLYKNAANIQQELRNVQHLVLKNNLRWMDVELALATNDNPDDNIIIDGFKAVEKNVDSFSKSADFGPAFVGLEKKEKGFVRATGKPVSKAEAKRIARSFLELKGTESIKVTASGKGADERFYSLTIRDPKAKSEIYMDITEKGGYPIWVLNSRPIKKQAISLHEAANRGMQFLRKHKFKNLELYDSAQYDNIALLTFVTNENGIRIYPETIKMKVALDDGTIVGFSARDYLATSIQRPLPKPTLTAEQARKKVNPNFKVMEQRQAVITNDMNKQVLCYEFLGTLGEDTYQIFINANTGMEENVEKLQSAEQSYS
ncbi:germination protein YpeB [Parageobacillus thermoglucosidasius]|uniref:Germination protein YpeB n=1 Tax=Geobacillus sp. (strain Y4.1MC1) TaxID=581103 RepID=A0A7U4DKJ1_GEOS0|nr:germination protein YpeB [Parageobacillus thermoglucosidasius]REK58638.1 MAG: germination protein YpeB [Geobacillus sp.]AEH47419.1 germination protein YpeB [Parageobacillus thermoglucosidasius C56-YS93]MBY6267152.1 germination protein YpeB [Parageobacillus thermoglucosidasius]MED4906038.1 germination protein YpeB [Parageobacillus thermoglucosidasius]MED4914489.1 germination protein YpeB [Parageobacillus thermoglucosidasius]